MGSFKRICLFVFCQFLLIHIVTAGYVLEVRAISYEHNAVGARTFLCIITDTCYTYFVFCVKQHPEDEGCRIGKVTTDIYDTSDRLTFSRTLSGGFSNPLVFLREGCWHGLSLEVSVHYWEHGSSDGLTIIRDDVLPSNDFTQETIVTRHNIMELGYRVRCLADYYGRNCSKYCRYTNSSEGHYYCDNYGNKRCLEGWTNPLTNCKTAICKNGCNLQPGAGSCSRPGDCNCGNHSQWTGALCDQCVPRKGCSATGYCVTPDECICRPGYIGVNCDIDATICDEIHTLKINRDQCVNTTSCSVEVYDNCSDVNSCIPSPCNEGLCLSVENDSYECLCKPGWTGTHCDNNIDDCQVHPCLNNGTCLDLVDAYQCLCTPEWGGENCSINYYKCYEDTCKNGATCEVLPDGFECNCLDGFTGEWCEQDMNECTDDPLICSGRGNCTNTFGSYNCSCNEQYQGRNCEIDTNSCRSSPCLNGGSCSNLDNDYACRCPRGFTGGRCQFNSSCTPSMCVNGRFEVENDTYECLCKPGWTGTHCDNNIDDCQVHPCLNNGTCLDHVDGYQCLCTPEWGGENCSINNYKCYEHTCKSGATCEVVSGSPVCVCNAGFTGQSCDVAITSTTTGSGIAQERITDRGLTTVLIIGWLVAIILLIVLVILIIVAAVLLSRARKRFKALSSNSEHVSNSANTAGGRHSNLSSRSRTFDNNLYGDNVSTDGLLQEQIESTSGSYDNPLYSDYQPFRSVIGSLTAASGHRSTFMN